MIDETDCADWMAHLPDKFWKVPLWNLAIPGSHDTMTYHLDDRSPLVPSASFYLRLLDKCFPCLIRPYVKRWATAQAWDISDQLDAGIRYLDLRVAHKKHDDASHFYFAHGIYSRQNVKDTVTDVAQWLEEHPKEVVIISCSAFDGMNEEEHLKLIHFLRRLFAKKLCPNKETPSLLLCWDRGYQVILSYENKAAGTYDDLWPQITYWWANTPYPKDLITFLEGQKKHGRPTGFFFVAGLNLTENVRYVIQHPCQTLRTMTLNAYKFLLDWVKRQHPGPSKTGLNIICADFVGDREFVRTVIELNKEMLS